MLELLSRFNMTDRLAQPEIFMNFSIEIIWGLITDKTTFEEHPDNVILRV